MAKHKTISLIIRTDLSNDELVEIFNNGTQNLKDLGIQLLEIRVVGSAVSVVKGINYKDEQIKKT